MINNIEEFDQERDPQRDSLEGLTGLSGLNRVKATAKQDALGVFSVPYSIYNTGVERSKYDQAATMPFQLESMEALNTLRGQEQSGVLKAFNAVIGGGLGGLFTAIEDLALIGGAAGQFLGLLEETEMQEGNAISNFAKQMKLGIHGAMPIYEEEGTSVMDKFLKWNTLRGIVDSAVGFGIPGGIIGKGVMTGMKGALRLARVNAYVEGILGVAHAATSGFIMNVGESAIMNVEMAEEAVQHETALRAKEILKDKYDNDEKYMELAIQDATNSIKVDKDFQRIVGERQEEFARMNKVMILSDGLGVHGLFKMFGSQRNLVNPTGLKQAFKSLGKLSSDNFFIQGAKEAVEEIYQNAIQSEGLYEIRKDTGRETQEDLLLPNSEYKRLIKFAQSDQALVEGLMGFFSGGAQRHLSQSFGDIMAGDPLGKARRDAQNKLYNQQEEFRKQLQLDQAAMINYELLTREAEIKGDKDIKKFLEDSHFNRMALKSFDLGAAELFERQLQDIANYTPERAKELGLNENYKADANARLKEFKALEKEYVKATNQYRQAGPTVLRKVLQNQHLISLMQSIDRDTENAVESVAKEVSTITGAPIDTAVLKSVLMGQVKLADTKLSQLEKQLITNSPLLNKIQEISKVKNEARDAYLKNVRDLTVLTSEKYLKNIDKNSLEHMKTARRKEDNETLRQIVRSKTPLNKYKEDDKGFRVQTENGYELDAEDQIMIVSGNDGKAYLRVKDPDTGAFINPINPITKQRSPRVIDEDLWEVLIDTYNAKEVAEKQRQKPDDAPPPVKELTEEEKALIEQKVEATAAPLIKDIQKKLNTKLNKKRRTPLTPEQIKEAKDSAQQEIDAIKDKLRTEATDAMKKEIGSYESYDQADFETVLDNVLQNLLHYISKDGFNDDASLRNAISWFFGTRGNIRGNIQNTKGLSNDWSTRKWFEFIRTHSFGRGSSFRGKLIPMSMEDMQEMFKEDPARLQQYLKVDPKTNQPFPNYYVVITNASGAYMHYGPNGTYTYSKNLDIKTAVKTTMASSETVYENVRVDATKEAFETARNAYKAFLQEHSGGKLFAFGGKSKGVYNNDDYTQVEFEAASEILGTDSTPINIKIAKSHNVAITDNIEVQVAAGTVVVHDSRTDEVYLAQSRNYTENEIETIKAIFEKFIQGSIKGSTFKKDASSVGIANMFDYLKSITLWSGNNKNREGAPIITEAAYQFYFPSYASDDVFVVIGGQAYSMIRQDGNKYVVNEEVLTKLGEYLATQKHHVRATPLETKTKYYSYSIQEGKLVATSYKTYKDYLHQKVLKVTAPRTFKTDNINGEEIARPLYLNQYLKIADVQLRTVNPIPVPPTPNGQPTGPTITPLVQAKALLEKVLSGAIKEGITTKGIKILKLDGTPAVIDYTIENFKGDIGFKFTINGESLASLYGTDQKAMGLINEVNGQFIKAIVAYSKGHTENITISYDSFDGTPIPVVSLILTPQTDLQEALGNIARLINHVYNRHQRALLGAKVEATATAAQNKSIVEQEQPVQSKIDEIEKRRQEELDEVISRLENKIKELQIKKDNGTATIDDLDGLASVKNYKTNYFQDNLNRINARYDAELAAIDQPKAEVKEQPIQSEIDEAARENSKNTPTSKITGKSATDAARLLKKIREGKPKTRTVSIVLNAKGKENVSEARAWFIKKFPNINFEVVEGLIRKGQYGEFMDYLVKIDKDAAKGTTFHEAFHVVFNLYMPVRERLLLIEAMKNDVKFTHYLSEAKQSYPELTLDEQIEEALAEIFADYMDGIIAPETTKSSLWEYLVGLFKDFMAYIGFANKVFNDTDYHKYIMKRMEFINKTPEYKLPKTPVTKSLRGHKSVIKGLDFLQTKDLLDGIQFYVMDFLKSAPKGHMNLYSQTKEATEVINNALAHAKRMIINKLTTTKDDILTLSEAMDAENSYEIEAAIEVYRATSLVLEQALKNWDNVLIQYKKYIKQFKINIDEVSLFEDAMDETNIARNANTSFKDSREINHKLYADRSIKLITSGLIAIDPETGEVVRNSLSLPVLMPFGTVYNLLTNKLGRLTPNMPIAEIKGLLQEVAASEPSIAQLYDEYRGIEEEGIEGDTELRQPILPINKMIDGSPISEAEVSLLTKFLQTFGKYKYETTFGFVQPETGTITIQNPTKIALRNRLYRLWDNQKRRLATGGSPYLTFDNQGNPQYVLSAFKDKEIGITELRLADDISEVKRRLDILGYSVSPSTLLAPGIKQVINTAIYNINKATSPIFKDPAIEEALVDLEEEYGTSIFENSHFGFKGKRVFNHNLHSYITLMVTKLNEVLKGKDIITKLRHLDPTYNIGTKHSLLYNMVKNRELKSIIFGINEGIKDPYSGDSVPYDKMTDIDRTIQLYTNMREGRFELLRTADSNQNRYLSIGRPFVAYEEFQEGNEWTDLVYNIFQGYLKDELAKLYNADNNYSHYKANHSSLNSLILQELLMGLTLDRSVTYEAAMEKLFTPENIPQIKNNLINMLNTEVSQRILTLKNLEIINSTEGVLTQKGFLPDQGNSTISQERLDRELYFLITNDWISSIEQMNVLFGDIAHYKNTLAAFKRFKGAVGTKKIIFTGDWINNWINENFQKTPDTNGKVHEHLYDADGNPLIRTAITNDISVISSFAAHQTEVLDKDHKDYIRIKNAVLKHFELNSIEEIYANEEALDTLITNIKEVAVKSNFNSAPYYNINEPDGFGYISMDAYKNLLLRSSLWSENHEKLYQWLQQHGQKTKTYIDPVTKEHTPLKQGDWGNVIFNPLKPQSFGPMANVPGFVPTMYKMALLPLNPELTENAPKLKGLHEKMIRENIDIVSYRSANKGAATKLNDKGTTNSLYNPDGEFDISTKWMVQDTYMEYWGIQLETGEHVKRKIPTGTQQMKHIINGIMERGMVASKFRDREKVKGLVDNYLAMNALRLKTGREILTKKLGLIYDGTEYTIEDISTLVDSLSDSAIERGMAEATFIGLEELRRGNAMIDALPNRATIESMIMGKGHVESIAIKRNGISAVQVASTMFETEARTVYSDGNLKSTDLKVSIQTNVDGQPVITSMQVYLPHFYKGKIALGTADPRLFKGLIGYRIPTQGLSSIESLEVMGFLPESAGDIVVLPSEIVAKAGSDFDIDKLFIYLPNTYQKGNTTTYIDFNTWQEDFNGNFKSIAQEAYKEFFDLTEMERGQYTLFEEALSKSNSIQELTDNLKILESSRRTAGNVENQIAELQEVIPYLEMVEDTFYLKAIENRVNELQHELLTLPERASELLAPVQANVLKEVASSINKHVKNKYAYDNEEIAAHNLLNREFLDRLNRTYIDGQIGIGPSALTGTFHILAQIHNFKINGSFKLAHNSEGNFIALGGLTTADGEYNVGDLINQMITGGVDVVNEPWAVDLGINTLTLNTFLFLLLTGVNPYTAAYFINQPIVHEYLEERAKRSSLYREVTNNKIASLDKIQKNLIKKYVTSDKTEVLYSSEMLEAELDAITPQYQLDIFAEFLKVEQLSSMIRDAVTTLTYDTNGGGTDISDLMEVLSDTQILLKDSGIINIDKVLTTGFLAPYFNNLVSLEKMITPLFHILNDELFGGEMGLFKRFIQFYKRATLGLGPDQYKASLKLFKEGFLAYKILSTPIPFRGNKPLSILADEFMKGSKSLASEIARLQTLPENDANMLLKYLIPVINSPGQYQYLKPEFGSLTPIELDQLTMKDWESLMDKTVFPFQNGSVGEYLMYQGLIQAGVGYSPMSFVQYAPPKMYSRFINLILANYETTNNTLQNYYAQFFITNNNNKNLVPISIVKYNHLPFKAFYPVKEEHAQESQEGRVALRKGGTKVYAPFPIMRARVLNNAGQPEFRAIMDGNRTVQIGGINYGENVASLLYHSTELRLFMAHLNKIGFNPYKDLPNLNTLEELLAMRELTNEETIDASPTEVVEETSNITVEGVNESQAQPVNENAIISKISTPTKGKQKVQYTLFNSILNKNVTKNGYKIIIPEFQNVELYLTNEGSTDESIEGSTEFNTVGKQWQVEVNTKDGVKTIPTPFAVTQKEVLEQFAEDINNKYSRTEHGRNVLKSVGIDLKKQSQPVNKLFNSADKELKKGAVVEYKGEKYLFWNQNSSGKAQLIKTDGTKFIGTPNLDKLTVLGSYTTTMYNNTEYIVTDNNNVYSGATGNLVYTGEDNSSKTQKENIINQAKRKRQELNQINNISANRSIASSNINSTFVIDNSTTGLPVQNDVKAAFEATKTDQETNC